jgi:hypothetical protein
MGGPLAAAVLIGDRRGVAEREYRGIEWQLKLLVES